MAWRINREVADRTVARLQRTLAPEQVALLDRLAEDFKRELERQFAREQQLPGRLAQSITE